MFSIELSSDEEYLYHYTSSATLALILDSGLLRLGEYAKTNDPRENGEWLASMSMNADFEDVHGQLDWLPLVRALDAALRHRTRLICLTTDREPAGLTGMSAFHRGWGRARMWSQYGEAHRGACLMFHRRVLDGAVAGAMGDVKLFSQPVRYSDGFDSASQLHVSVEDLVERGVAAVADDLIAMRGGELFFEKNRDWSTESEFRYVVVGEKAPEFVNIEAALAAVVIGMDFPSHELSVISTRLDRLHRSDVPVARARWMSGRPVLVPALPPPSASAPPF